MLEAQAARDALAAARNSVTLSNLGSMLLQQSWSEPFNGAMLEEAHALLRDAIELSDGGRDSEVDIVALYNFGNAQAQLAMHAEAAATYARYCAFAPDDPDGHASRAASLQNCDRYGEAVAAYSAAVRLDPRDAQSWVQRGESLRYLEQPEEAIESFNRAIAVLERCDRRVGRDAARNDSGSDSEEEEEEDEEVTAALLEHAHHCVAMTRAMQRESRRSTTGSNRLAVGAPLPPSRCANGYVSGLFDQFAATFDERLVEDLQYTGHERVADAARRSVGGAGEGAGKGAGEGAGEGTALAPRAARGELRVLDLGAGTGLCGKLCAAWCSAATGALVGVDLSKKMLDAASRLGVYDELAVAEITAWCVAHAARGGIVAEAAPAPAPAAPAARPFDIVLAADTLVYFGELDELFAAVAHPRLLARSGRFVFSSEALHAAEGKSESEGEGAGAGAAAAATAAAAHADADGRTGGWELQGSGRYAHSRACVLRAARRFGLVLESCECAVTRKEGGVDVMADIFCLRRGTK